MKEELVALRMKELWSQTPWGAGPSGLTWAREAGVEGSGALRVVLMKGGKATEC